MTAPADHYDTVTYDRGVPTVRPGIYLQDNPPRRAQWSARDETPSGLLVGHTAEGGSDIVGPDPKAENVANFIRTRTTAGSYHVLGDRDSIIPMVHPRLGAYGCRFGVNDYALHWSLAMNAGDWRQLPDAAAAEYLETAVQMALILADWVQDTHGVAVPPVLLSRRSAMARRPGFCSHGRLDPDRRSDPGRHFPWLAFLVEYAGRSGWPTSAIKIESDPSDDLGATMADVKSEQIRSLQRPLVAMGFDLGRSGPNRDGVDGVWGPKTAAALLAAYQRFGGDIPTGTDQQLQAALTEALAARDRLQAEVEQVTTELDLARRVVTEARQAAANIRAGLDVLQRLE